MPPKTAGKDIRSFFTSISSKTAPKTEVAEDKKDSESGLKKKKVRAIIDSDSDEEANFSSSRSTSKKIKEEKAKTPIKKEGKATKPLSPLKPVDIKSVFGDAPIYRSKDAPEKRKRKVEEHEDEAFAAALQQADESVANKKNKSKEKEPVRKKIKEEVQDKEPETKTSVKTEKEKTSPSKPEKTKKSSGKSDLVEIKSKTPTKKIKTKSTDIIFESPPKKEESASTAESPSVDPLEKRKQKSENYRKFLANRNEGAKNPGSKPVPEGAPGCMEGLTVVVTGVLESLHRDEAEELVRKYGGKVTHSISKNTSYVLAGEDAGPAKMTKAKDLKVAVINEDEFLEMIASRPAGTGSSTSAKKATPKSAQKTTKVKEEKLADPEKNIKKSPEKKTKLPEEKVKSPEKKTKSSEKKTTSPELKKTVQQASTRPTGVPTSIKSDSSTDAALPWVDKYKPTSIKQIIGQQGDRSNARKLLHWLQHWYENHSGKKKLTKPSPWSTNDDGAYFKAALLSGPPGIGKTTTAHLVSKELGYDLVEMNASDTRSKRLLHEHVTELLSCQSLSSFAHGSSHMNGKKRVLVMDEVDGMAGNEDRGGMQELIGLIKTSKIPVICICNDRQHPKVRSLSNYCYDLKFSKPRVEQIRGAMMSICFKEGVKLKPEALDEIATGANQDIRQVLHHLSILSSKEKNLSTEQAKLDAAKSKKDFKLGPWDVTKKVFSIEEHQNMSMMDKAGLFFQDYSLGPLFVQENYLQVVPHAAKGNTIATLDLIARTADSLSTTDLIEKVIRSQMAWSLLPVEAMFASVIPGQLMEGRIAGQINFPSWLGKNSRQNKMDRLLQELQLHMRLKISASKRALNLDYLPHVINSIVGPLRRDASQGVDASVKAMESYDLMREDLDSLLEVGQWPNRPEIMAGIDGKVKAAFTRAYNKEGHMTPYAASVKTTRGRTKVADDVDIAGAEGEEADDDDDDANDADDVTHDAMIKIKKTTKKATVKKETVKKETVKKESGRGGRSTRGAKSKRE